MAVCSADTSASCENCSLTVKVQYPSICEVNESDLDKLLKDLQEDIDSYACTLLASYRDASTKTLTRFAVNFVTGGPDCLIPYCKTIGKDGDKVPAVLIELWTTDKDFREKTHVIDTVKSKVGLHIKSKTNQPLRFLSPAIVVYSEPDTA